MLSFIKVYISMNRAIKLSTISKQLKCDVSSHTSTHIIYKDNEQYTTGGSKNAPRNTTDNADRITHQL